MNKINLIKIGGNLIDNSEQLDSFLEAFVTLKGPKILVHGGGKTATSMATKMNLAVQMHQGRRITDGPNLEIITMVYGGLINKKLVAQLQALGADAIGLSGADGNTILATKRPPAPIDYGFVGDVKTVNATVLTQLIALNKIPVLCSITHNGKGQLLNTNADTIAAQVAIALAKQHEVHLHYCFEKEGVLEDVHDEASVLPKIDTQKYEALKAAKQIAGGMLPKLSNCFEALQNGVKTVHVGGPNMLNLSTLHTQIEL
ncbi:MAG: acetylglutamate kinase [Flavobacteriaceae bacterium]|jgi:acetylglutamate kinase